MSDGKSKDKPEEILNSERILRICRAYGYTPDQVYELDYPVYLTALKDLADCPLVDQAFFRFIGGQGEKAEMTVAQRRAAMARSARRQ